MSPHPHAARVSTVAVLVLLGILACSAESATGPAPSSMATSSARPVAGADPSVEESTTPEVDPSSEARDRLDEWVYEHGCPRDIRAETNRIAARMPWTISERMRDHEGCDLVVAAPGALAEVGALLPGVLRSAGYDRQVTTGSEGDGRVWASGISSAGCGLALLADEGFLCRGEVAVAIQPDIYCLHDLRAP